MGLWTKIVSKLSGQTEDQVRAKQFKKVVRSKGLSVNSLAKRLSEEELMVAVGLLNGLTPDKISANLNMSEKRVNKLIEQGLLKV